MATPLETTTTGNVGQGPTLATASGGGGGGSWSTTPSATSTQPTATSTTTGITEKPVIVATGDQAGKQIEEAKVAVDKTSADMQAQAKLIADNKAKADEAKVKQDLLYKQNPYWVRPGEKTDAYNARIAEMRKTGEIPTTGVDQAIEETKTPETGTLDDINTARIKDIRDQIAKADATLNETETNITNVQNGTTPLTADQQAILDGIKAKFANIKAMQAIANKNYEGGTQAMGAVSGRSRYAPDLAAGELKAAVDSGIAKLNQLEMEQAQTMAELTQAFKDKNIKSIEAKYERFSKFAAEKTAALTKIGDIMSEQEKTTREWNYKVTQDAIANDLKQAEMDMAENKFDYQKTQDAINNKIAQANLSLSERKQALAESAAALQEKMFNMINSSPTVPTGVDGRPSEAAQAEYLKSFPAGVQELIKGVADYTINPSVLSTSAKQSMGKMTQGDLVAAVKKYDPSYNMQQYPARQKFLSAWTAGGQNAVAQAANTAIQHLGELKAVYDKIAIGSDAGILNKNYNTFQQFIEKNKSNPDVARFGTIVQSLGGELSKIYKNGINSSASPTEQEAAEVKEILNLAWGTEGLNGILESTSNLMRDRLNTAKETYASTMGKEPPSLLLPSAQKSIDAMNAAGLNIDFSSLNPLSNVSNDDLMGDLTGSNSTAAGVSVQNNLEKLKSWFDMSNQQLNQ